MSADALPFTAPLADYQRQADALLAALHGGDNDARWRFKWEHPRFKDSTVKDADVPTLAMPDAQLVVARTHAFLTWEDLVAFTTAVHADAAVARFETAVEAVITGDLAALRAMLAAHPELARARSARRHHATLLHYIAANGVEGYRQLTPPNAVEVARTLLDAGAEVDALADMYENRCTTMSMLVSSSPPDAAGLQTALVELLLDRGAAPDGPGSKWTSAVMTALSFGFPGTAEMLARRDGAVDSLPAAAGLGRMDDLRRLLPAADAEARHWALALAAQLGQVEAVRALLDAGEDPDRFNPEGCHAHATPLHNAVWNARADVVRLLVERGARLDIRDRIFDATPLGWAEYGKKTEAAAFLRSRGGG
jgi:ankyrin repeat protein